MSHSAAQRPLRVVVVNDSTHTLGTISSWLEIHGYSVFPARLPDMRDLPHSLQEILTFHRPQVMVFDVGTPYQSNWDFLEVVQALGEAKNLPIVVTTPNKAALLRVAPDAGDAVEIVGRPEDLNVLLQRVADAASPAVSGDL